MQELNGFFIILFFGVFFSIVFKKMHIPWVVSLIIGGMIIGPHGFGLLQTNTTLDFMGQIGLVFLMFMAGLETKFTLFKNYQKRLFTAAFVNGFIPFLIGLSIALVFGYSFTTSIFVGIIFISSSVAILIPLLTKTKLINTPIGQSSVMNIMIQDIASLILVLIVLQNVSPTTNIPLFLFFPLVLLTLFVFKIILPKLNRLLSFIKSDSEDMFQQDFRFVFLILLGTVIIFELLGLHPIIAAFFTGLVLSESINSALLKEKIRTISYGIFIPTFFIIIGTQTNITVFKDISGAILLALAIILGLIISKFISGLLGARILGFKSNEALFFATSSIPQLSTTLAVTATAFSLNIIDQALMTSMILLSVCSILVGPIFMNKFGEKVKEEMKVKGL